MKIKRLTIRNIASIEKGEIDFEHGLIDRESGNPASLFLITGDTGSGKSVILDCISMALYGTTPRVKSVSDVRKNTYHNNSGEEISVNDITQYTRIGISHKDECYTELSFTGNDNVDYISRFTLGRTNRNNYRSPEWTLKIGNSKIIENRKDEIRDRIKTAVGLSFEQFSRMAMLAQGQFATFLTGKKEERERILEQLTATDIFSRYGEAISIIYKNAKQETETSQKIYDEFSKKILDETEIEELTAEQLEKSKLASSYQTETEKLRQKIQCTEKIKQAISTISSLKEEASKLKAFENSTIYRKLIKILELWDATTSQRELLSDKIKTSEVLKNDKRSLQEKKAEFVFLSSDLSVRKQKMVAKSKLLERQKAWLQSQEPLKQLFSDSAAVVAEIISLEAIEQEIDKKEKSNITVKFNIDVLNKNISDIKEKSVEKNKLCKDTQEEIDKKYKIRDGLNPASLRKENEILTKREASLKDLSSRLATFELEKQELEIIENEFQKLSLLLDEQKTISDNASKEADRLEKEKNTAESRYLTMHLSLEENYESMRQKLVEEHATNCPLCGQSLEKQLHKWENNEVFNSILSPLEEEKNKSAEAYNLAKKHSDEAKEIMNTTSGSLKAKVADLKARKMKLENSEKENNKIITSLGIDTSLNIKELIDNEIEQIKQQTAEISKKLEQTELLQREIDTLLQKKNTLDMDYQELQKSLQVAQKNVAQKEVEFKQTRERIIELKNEKGRQTEKISIELKGYSENWEENPLEIAMQLKKDAKEFMDRAASYAKELPEHQVELNIIESISSVQENLSDILESVDSSADYSSLDDSKSLNLFKLQEKWSNILSEVSAINKRIAEYESKIDEINDKLQKYYQSTGISETTLLKLADLKDVISKMRNIQERHRNKLQINSALLSEAIKTKDENLKTLNIEDESKLEDINLLNDNLKMLTDQYAEVSQRIGAIKEKLKSDENIRKDSEKQRVDLENKKARREKWEKMNKYFGGTRFRTLVQSHILRPLLNNANIYLRQITDHYTLTCSDENEQLSILVRDRYHNNEPRSVTVLSGGERFMVSLALSLALSAMNRPDFNVDILFIDEGFGTLDAKSLDMVMSTLRRLPEINGQSGRRVGVISHREELTEQIDCQIQLKSFGEGRSRIVIK